MCIVFMYFCDDPSPDGYRLIVASNRDEVYSRPTAQAKFWEEYPDIIAGMDMKSGREGGTWIGMKTDGKFAATTFYRQSKKFIVSKAKGRGHLVSDFLKGDDDAENYLKKVRDEGDLYNGFNLLVGELSPNGETKMGWYCNIEDKQVTMLKPGIHVLSNKTLNCSWPKMGYGKKRFARIIETTSTKEDLVDELLWMLKARQRSFSVSCGDHNNFIAAQDEGFDDAIIEASRAIFVRHQVMNFGTRTNTVMLVDATGHATYVERTMDEHASDPDEAEWTVNSYEFEMFQKTEACTEHEKSKEKPKRRKKGAWKIESIPENGI